MNSRVTISWFLIFLFSLTLAIIASYQVMGESRDYINYLNFFNFIIAHHLQAFDYSYRFEPGFTSVAYVLAWAGFDALLIYFIIAGFAVLIKYSSLLSVSSDKRYWAAFTIFSYYFFTRYFVLFEMTVLRATCAFALAFFVFFKRNNESYRFWDVVILVVAVTFHYSAIVFLPIYFLRGLTLGRIAGFFLVAFAVVSSSKNFMLSQLPEYFVVFNMYEGSGSANPFPLPYLVDLAYFFGFMLMWRANDMAMKYCLAGVALGAAFHFSLFELSILASRLRELLSVFILIHVVRASLSRLSHVRVFSWAYAFTSGLLNFYGMLVYDPLLS